MSNVVGIAGSLTFDFEQMMNDAMHFDRNLLKRFQMNVKLSIPRHCLVLHMGATISTMTHGLCVNSTTNMGYYFPVRESENHGIIISV